LRLCAWPSPRIASPARFTIRPPVATDEHACAGDRARRREARDASARDQQRDRHQRDALRERGEDLGARATVGPAVVGGARATHAANSASESAATSRPCGLRRRAARASRSASRRRPPRRDRRPQPRAARARRRAVLPCERAAPVRGRGRHGPAKISLKIGAHEQSNAGEVWRPLGFRSRCRLQVVRVHRASTPRTIDAYQRDRSPRAATGDLPL
jgi:hypothetical protein